MNQTVLEILTEELSMEYFLRGLLPRILPSDYILDANCFIRTHEGKSHLKKSIPKKINAYQKFNYPVKVLIIHDQDSNDCLLLKQELLDLCHSIVPVPVMVRIACRELENWYFGDLKALKKVYPEINKVNSKSRNIDHFQGSYELERLTKKFSKTSAAREISKYIDINNNLSPSFNQFVIGLGKFLT